MKQKLFTLFLALVASVSAIYASYTKVDGIWYDFYVDNIHYKYVTNEILDELLYEEADFNKFTSISLIGSQNWQRDGFYGALMSGYSDSDQKTYQNEDWLISPAMDLSPYQSATLNFRHAFGPRASIPTTAEQKAQYTCWVSNDFNGDVATATWTELPITYGTSAWSYITTTVDIPAENLQENCHIAWKYICANSSATWEISSVKVEGVYEKDVEVIARDDKYSGDVVIPSVVTHNDVDYNVVAIASEAFYDCSSLTSVTIPNSVTSIGVEAFGRCYSLTSVVINSDAIVNKAYTSSYNLSDGIFGSQVTEYIIGDNVKGIGDYAFYGCSSLTSVTIGESVTSIGDDAFYDCSSLTSVTIPNSVTSIGYGAFRGCSKLTSPVYNAHCFAYMPTSYSGAYTIPEGIKQIAGGAFEDCSSLTSVTIGNSVTSIGKGAFRYCYSLTSITCEAETPPTIGGTYTFDGVSKSIPVYVPCGCVEAYKAASGWSDFTNIQVPLAEYSIEVDVNDTIMGSAKVDINNACGAQISATPNFGYHFVQWSDGNTDNPHTLELTQDTTLTAEFAQSFSGQCGDSLYWELVDDTLHITGRGEMYNYNPDTAPWKLLVSSSKTLTIAEDVTMIGNDAFDGCTALESIVWNAIKEVKQGITIKAKMPNHWYSQITAWVWTTASDGHVVYPTYENGWYVVTVNTPTINIIFRNGTGWTGDSNQTVDLFYNENAYLELQQSGNKKATPQGKNHLGSPFFDIRSQIKSFTFGDAVERIPAYLCYGMDKLTSMTIPNSVTSIGKSTFYGCSSLTSVTIPNSVTSIGKSTFEGCSSLTSVTIPESVTSIGESTFYGCSKLTSVTIPNSVTSIGYMAFYECSSLTSITIPNSVTSIINSAFEGCSSLTSITIPNSVTSIGDAAFSSCNNVTSVTWNAKNCNTYNFGSQVTSFEFGNEVEVVPSSLCKGMEKLTSVTIPNSVTSIGVEAFYNCSSLTSVTIPNSVKTIGSSAFEGCARLGKISLGTGLEEIAANAFAGCTRLYDIYVYATYPPFAEESSFANYNVYVYVPCEYQRDYTLDIVWGKFKFIECIDSEDATTDGNVIVVPGFNDVTITWPTAENADSYSLVINKDNQPFCTLTFNQDGQLLNIAFAPGRDGNHPVQYAAQTVSGYRFTVTGLTEATQYVYNITTKDADNNTIATYSGEFTTMGGSTSAVEDILQNTTNVQKLLRNGQLIIIRDGVEYNAMGQEM